MRKVRSVLWPIVRSGDGLKRTKVDVGIDRKIGISKGRLRHTHTLSRVFVGDRWLSITSGSSKTLVTKRLRPSINS